MLLLRGTAERLPYRVNVKCGGKRGVVLGGAGAGQIAGASFLTLPEPRLLASPGPRPRMTILTAAAVADACDPGPARCPRAEGHPLGMPADMNPPHTHSTTCPGHNSSGSALYIQCSCPDCAGLAAQSLWSSVHNLDSFYEHATGQQLKGSEARCDEVCKASVLAAFAPEEPVRAAAAVARRTSVPHVARSRPPLPWVLAMSWGVLRGEGALWARASSAEEPRSQGGPGGAAAVADGPGFLQTGWLRWPGLC
jgi:hypothetical protein